jgi:hypothetical protein
MIFLQRTADHVSSLARPLLLGHRLVADDVLAQDMLELLRVAPVLWIAIFEPVDSGCRIRRDMLDVGRVDWFPPMLTWTVISELNLRKPFWRSEVMQ